MNPPPQQPYPQGPPPPGYAYPPGYGVPPKKSGKCWFWGCGGCLGLFVIGAVSIFLFVKAGLKKVTEMEPFKTAVTTAKASPVVQGKLGQPIEIKKQYGILPFQGRVEIANNVGSADFTIILAGPSGEGTLHAMASQNGDGPWQYSALEFTPSGATEKIPLMPSGAASPAKPAPVP